MPHVVVKLWPGPSESQKAELAQAIAEALKNTIGSADKSISVAIEEVVSEDWMTQVYHPEIAPRLASLYKKPGYGPT
ncbi:MAG: tautomerase family protein [Pseudomonadota bacterium]